MPTIAIDGGTTNTRAVLLDGRVAKAVAHRAVGVRDTAIGSSNVPLLTAIAACVDEVLRVGNVDRDAIGRICASGMLTSNVGLVDLPHLSTPTSRADLARGVDTRVFPEIDHRPIHFVRGVKVGDDAGPDMMRGEECEAFGLLTLSNRKGPATLVLPGSHTKVIEIDEADRIVALRTSLGGEMIQALSQHTVLAGSMPTPLPTEVDAEMFRLGAERAVASGLLHAAFRVRVAQVLEGRTRDQCAALLVGMVIGSDVDAMARSGQWRQDRPILVGGSEPLRSLYAARIRDAIGADGKRVIVMSDETVRSACAVGAAEIVALAETA